MQAVHALVGEITARRCLSRAEQDHIAAPKAKLMLICEQSLGVISTDIDGGRLLSPIQTLC